MDTEDYLPEENDEVDTSAYLTSNAQKYVLNANSSVHSKKPYYKLL